MLAPSAADAFAAALLALVALPPMLADAGAPALLAYAAHPPVLVDAFAAAVFAGAALPAVRAGHDQWRHARFSPGGPTSLVWARGL